MKVLVLALVIFFAEAATKIQLDGSATINIFVGAENVSTQNDDPQFAVKNGGEKKNEAGGNGSVEKSEPNNKVPAQ